VSHQVFVAALVAALVSLGLASPSYGATANTTAVAGSVAAPAAAPAKAPTATVTPGKHGVAALCGTPKKGTAQCFALRRTDIVGRKGISPAVTPNGFGPADLGSAYGIPANGGAGQTVAIVDAFDDPNAESDLGIYRSQYGLAPCTTANGCFSKVDQRGGNDYPEPNADWAGEISLDVDMVSAIAPAAHILLVEADTNNNDDLAAAVDEAVALGAKYVSNSYGSAYTSVPGSGEDPSELTEDAFYNHPGVAVVASTGDDNFGVSYPAASQYVTSVGGTSLVADTSTRGWSESVWNNSFGGPGSGCSVFEPKPSWQSDSGCAMRTESDVAAVADPETGVAVYDTYQNPGWGVFGGTSVSSPIIASVFADAGTPVAGTYPSSYPYAATGSLNDVTTGNNGTCSPAYLCTAGAGYDGPTGLGTPHGLSAFTTGPHGQIAGVITDSATSAPIAGASVAAGTSSATTDATGHYSLSAPVGTYDVTASAYGYTSKTVTSVAVTDGGSVTENFALAAQPSVTVTGKVTDGSGHHWPLYATITAAGVPGGPVYTNPYNGTYSLTLPAGATYQLHVAANYSGYQPVDTSVTLAGSGVTKNIAVPVDAASCVAPGYAVHFAGLTQSFDGTTTPTGWTVTNNTDVGGWEFDDPEPRGNLTGGSGGFAIVDSDFLGEDNTEDTYLVSPAADLTGMASPELGFDTDYNDLGSTAQIDLSLDGGATWTNVWDHSGNSLRGPAHIDLPLPQAANKASAQVRFHYTGTWDWWWELDNVFLGVRSCDPVAGGLVAGVVTDANTGNGVVGATVTSVDAPSTQATSAATPADAALGDGFYWLFSALTGSHTFTAAKAHYVSTSKAVSVAADKTTKALFTLKAGQITITPTSIDTTVPWQGTATQKVTVKNTGGAPATVTIGEQPGGSSPLGTGAPRTRITGTYTPHSLHTAKGAVKPNAKVAPASTTPSAAPWTEIADYPTTIQDNGVATDGGKVYSGFGFNGTDDTSNLNVYDPDTGSWTALAAAADTREKPAFAFVDGTLYAAGGWGADGNPDPKLEVYDPSSNAWTTGASDPDPLAGSGVAVLNGKIYIVGGCGTASCGSTDVNVYDPGTNTWSTAADYPEAVAWESCGAIGAKLYCAGGVTDDASITHAYAYDPGSDSWSPVADLPADLWGSGYTAAEGQLLVSGGVMNDSLTLTNVGYAFDPNNDAWSALPNSNNTLYRGGSACGLYRVGGSPGGQSAPVASSEVLPGFVDCGQAVDVSWLSESPTTLTLAAGKSATFTVSLDAGVPDITQPGTYTAKVSIGTDTPYSVPAIGVTMVVNPPKTWGKITGTVTGNGVPLAGATVQITTWATHYTLKTDKNGQYALWLDVRNNPLQLIVAKDGYQPQVKTVKIAKGTTTTANFALLID
jgi:N-acetylneuraminic acid mutarotase